MINTPSCRLMVLLYFLLSACTISLSQKNTNYPFEIDDLSVKACSHNATGKDYLLHVKFMGADYVILSLRESNEPTVRSEPKIVRPFTLENFSQALRQSVEEVYSISNRGDGEGGEEVNAVMPCAADTVVHQDMVGVSNTAPATRHETNLYYQMIGAQTSGGASEDTPVAGKICVQPNINIQRTLDAYELKRNYHLRKVYVDSLMRIARKEGKMNRAFNKKYKKMIEDRFNAEQERYNQYRKSNVESEFDVAKEERDMIKEEYKSGSYLLSTKIDTLRRLLRPDTSIQYAQISRTLWYFQNNLIDSSLVATLKKNTSEKVFAALTQGEYGKRIEELEKIKSELRAQKLSLAIAQQELDFVTQKRILIMREVSSPSFDLESMKIEFNEGFIENIVVVGNVLDNAWDETDEEKLYWGDSELKKKQIIFENQYPIGFSRKRDYKNLKKLTLNSVSKNDGERYTMELGDLFTDYIYDINVGRRDYSPANVAIIYDPNIDDECITLYKEATKKLFEARIYSDFVGLDQKKNNGLIQTEIAKRLNLNTKRLKTGSRENFGLLAWLEPTFTLSKIEQHNRRLNITQKALPLNGRMRYYTSTLDIKRQEMINVGIRTNLLYVDMPFVKSTLSLNTGFNYGRTPISINQDTTFDGLNTYSFFGELTTEIKADERWGVGGSFRANSVNVLDRNIIQVVDEQFIYEPRTWYSTPKWYNTAQLWAYVQPADSNKGKIFFRYRYNWQLSDQNIGFHQIQLGYSFYLMSQAKS